MKKIVVINDDKDFLDAISLFLKDCGHDPIIIFEGKTAYKKVKKILPDLIILDIRMDGPEAGWKILDLLTLDTKTRDIPVIVCSAVTKFPDGKEPWLAEHGISVLPKPFDIDDLSAMLEKAFLKRKASLISRPVN